MRVFICAACALGLVACGGAKTEDATNELRPHMEKVYAAWATLDSSKPAPYYAKDAGLAFFDVAPLQYHGWQEYEDGFKKVSADWASAKVTVGPDLKAYKRDDLAWVTYTLDLDITMKNGDPMKAQARGTDILEKRGDNWMIVHEHVSMPMAEPAPAPKPEAAKPVHHKHKGKK